MHIVVENVVEEIWAAVWRDVEAFIVDCCYRCSGWCRLSEMMTAWLCR